MDPAPATAARTGADRGTYAALALDLDGTLLTPDGDLTSGVIALLQELSRRVLVVLATGRMLPSAQPFYEQLGLSTPIVTYNGARVGIPGQAPLHDVQLPPDLSNEVDAWCRAEGIHLNHYIDDRIYIHSACAVAEWYSRHFRAPLSYIDESLRGRRPTKLLAIVETSEQLVPTYERMRERFGMHCDLTTSSRRFVELLPQGTSKGAALARLADHTGIPLAQWVAAGDGMNDAEMLRAAGLGIAIEDGDPRLHPEADLILPALPAGGLEKLIEMAFGG